MASNNNSQYSVSWESYHSNVCSGFTAFQQNGEFVDMTIAADKHVVKVHKALVALASPYLKEIIQATPANQHPVIFLNNVNYDTLCELLEYIYTGEVVVPLDHLKTFMETGKSLNIRGLENVKDIRGRPTAVASAPRQAKTQIRKSVILTSQIKKIATPTLAKEEHFVPEPETTVNISTLNPTENYNPLDTEMTFDDNLPVSDDNDADYSPHALASQSSTRIRKGQGRGIEANMQYTVSTRGSLQMILNRYLYNLQWKSRSDTRRWRCVDYRHSRCQAYVITKDKLIMNRGHPHNHGFHDRKILTKLRSNAVYSEIDDVSGVHAFEDCNTTKDATEDSNIMKEEESEIYSDA